MSQRDIESLGVMGWGLEAARKFFRRHRRRYKTPIVYGYTVKKCERFKQNIISDLDLRIARIDLSRQVSMDERRENENELSGIANTAF